MKKRVIFNLIMILILIGGIIGIVSIYKANPKLEHPDVELQKEIVDLSFLDEAEEVKAEGNKKDPETFKKFYNKINDGTYPMMSTNAMASYYNDLQNWDIKKFVVDTDEFEWEYVLTHSLVAKETTVNLFNNRTYTGKYSDSVVDNWNYYGGINNQFIISGKNFFCTYAEAPFFTYAGERYSDKGENTQTFNPLTDALDLYCVGTSIQCRMSYGKDYYKISINKKQNYNNFDVDWVNTVNRRQWNEIDPSSYSILEDGKFIRHNDYISKLGTRVYDIKVNSVYTSELMENEYIHYGHIKSNKLKYDCFGSSCGSTIGVCSLSKDKYKFISEKNGIYHFTLEDGGRNIYTDYKTFFKIIGDGIFKLFAPYSQVETRYIYSDGLTFTLDKKEIKDKLNYILKKTNAKNLTYEGDDPRNMYFDFNIDGAYEKCLDLKALKDTIKNS